jgi:diguanylate cyclase (GGDEF)-like protein
VLRRFPRGPHSRGRERGAWSVRAYLVLIVAVAVVAITTASVYGFVWSSGQARDSATKRMDLQAQRAASAVASGVATARATVEGLAAQPGLLEVFARPKGCTLTAKGSGAFPNVRMDIVRPDGSVACSSERSAAVAAPGVHGDSGWLRPVLRAPATVVDWRATDAAARVPSVVVGVPLKDAAGNPAGAAVLFLHVPAAASALAREYRGIAEASFTVVDRRSQVVVSTSRVAGQRSGRLSGMRFPDARRQGEWAGVDGSRRLFGSRDVAGSPWRVYSGVRRSAVLADARGALTRQGLVGLIALLVLAIGVWIVNRRVAGPLRAVIDAVRRARRDPDGAQVRELGPAEVVALAREFNSMLDVRSGHEAQLVHQATHDRLTGLPNRVLLRERLDGALRNAGDDGDVAVLCFGVDRLDIVKDGFGHDAGDRLLVEVSERLQTLLRPGDTLARFGADEFVVLCEAGPADDVIALVEQLQHCLEQPVRGPGSDVVLQAAIGLAFAGGPGTRSDQLLREADSAMREARSTGRPWHLFANELQLRATQHLEVEHALWQALKRDELVVHYQPLLDIETRRIVGTEALVRWQHPERGLVPPMDFIPIAEETGQIAAIGEHVLRSACRQAAAWAAAGHPLRMSVNVSVGQLRDQTFPRTVEQALSEAGLAADQLCLEITESALLREATQESLQLVRLKRLGVRLAIDDFGTGYSSLSYLHDLPVDQLKIDRSFVSRLDRGLRDHHLVEAIIVMARALNLDVVAEGVEHERQLGFLTGAGCQLAQGYLFARPQTADGVLQLLERQRAARPLALAG